LAVAGVTGYCLTGGLRPQSEWDDGGALDVNQRHQRAGHQKPRVLRKGSFWPLDIDSRPWWEQKSKHPPFKGGRKDGRGTDRSPTRLAVG
jgi:hypothetical protein